MPTSQSAERVERALAPRAGRIPAASLADHGAMLLSVARDLFYQAGYEGTSIETIARAARVSPKTIYGRYGGKPGLFIAVMHARADEVLRILREPIATDKDLSTALVEFAERLLVMTTSDEALTLQRLVFAEAQRFPDFGAAFFENGPGRGIRAFAEFLVRANAAGILTVDDPEFAAEYFCGALVGIPVRLALTKGEKPDLARARIRAERTVETFLRAFRRASVV